MELLAWELRRPNAVTWGRPCGERALAGYTMAMLNTFYDTPACSPVDDGSADSQLDTTGVRVAPCSSPGAVGPRGA